MKPPRTLRQAVLENYDREIARYQAMIKRRQGEAARQRKHKASITEAGYLNPAEERAYFESLAVAIEEQIAELRRRVVELRAKRAARAAVDA